MHGKILIENIVPLSFAIAFIILFAIPMVKSIKEILSSKKDPDYVKWLEEQKIKNGK